MNSTMSKRFGARFLVFATSFFLLACGCRESSEEKDDDTKDAGRGTTWTPFIVAKKGDNTPEQSERKTEQTEAGKPYVFEKAWPGELEGWHLVQPAGVAVDSKGNVLVADRGSHRILKTDSSGKLLAKWGSEGRQDGVFPSPDGIAVDSQGNVFVADAGKCRIHKFDSSVRFLTTWGSMNEFYFPAAVAVDSQGNVFVADFGNAIKKFNSSGKLLTQWRLRASADKEHRFPPGIAVDSIGNVIVTDRRTPQLMKFDSSGRLIKAWRCHADAVAVDSTGNVFAATAHDHKIRKFDSSGTLLAEWGSQGSSPGEFRSPSGVAVDALGNVYVADTGNKRVQKFRPARPDRVAKKPAAASGQTDEEAFEAAKGDVSLMYSAVRLEHETASQCAGGARVQVSEDKNIAELIGQLRGQQGAPMQKDEWARLSGFLRDGLALQVWRANSAEFKCVYTRQPPDRETAERIIAALEEHRKARWARLFQSLGAHRSQELWEPGSLELATIETGEPPDSEVASRITIHLEEYSRKLHDLLFRLTLSPGWQAPPSLEFKERDPQRYAAVTSLMEKMAKEARQSAAREVGKVMSARRLEWVLVDVLASKGDEKSIRALRGCLKSSKDREVKVKVAGLLYKHGEPELAAGFLVPVLSNADDPLWKDAVALASRSCMGEAAPVLARCCLLEGARGEAALAAILKIGEEGFKHLKPDDVQTLGTVDSPEIVRYLESLAMEPGSTRIGEAQLLAADILAARQSEKAVTALLNIADDGAHPMDVREAAVSALVEGWKNGRFPISGLNSLGKYCADIKGTVPTLAWVVGQCPDSRRETLGEPVEARPEPWRRPEEREATESHEEGPEPVPKPVVQEDHARDAIRSLGNMGPRAKSAVPALITALGKSGVREYAIEALGKIGPDARDAVPALTRMLTDVRVEMMPVAEALESISGTGIQTLIMILGDQSKDWQLREDAIKALAKMGPRAKQAIPALVHALKDNEPEVRARAAAALGRMGPTAKTAVPNLVDLFMTDHERETPRCVAMALGEIGADAEDAVPALVRVIKYGIIVKTPDGRSFHLLRALEDPASPVRVFGPDVIKEALRSNDEARRLAIQTLGKIGRGAKLAVPALTELLMSGDDQLRLAALEALAELGAAAEPAVPTLTRLLADDSYKMGKAAVKVLGRVGEGAKPAVPALTRLLDSDSYELSLEAVKALGRIGKGAKDAAPALTKLLEEERPKLRRRELSEGDRPGLSLRDPAAAALAEIDTSALAALLKHQKWEVRSASARALGGRGTGARRWLPELIVLFLSDEQPNVRAAAAFALRQIDPDGKAVVPAVIGVLRHESDPGREAALRALPTISEKEAAALMGFLKDPAVQQSVGALGTISDKEAAALMTFLQDPPVELPPLGRGALQAAELIMLFRDPAVRLSLYDDLESKARFGQERESFKGREAE